MARPRLLGVPPNQPSPHASACVERLDLRLVVRGDDGALDLHRRGQLAALLGEVPGEDGDLLHLLDPGELPVDLLDMGFDRPADLLVGGELSGVLG